MTLPFSPRLFLPLLAMAAALPISLAEGAVIFDQDFSSSSDVADYETGGGASGSLFDFIGQNDGATGYSNAITGGALAFISAEGSTGGQSAYRVLSATPFPLLQMQFTLRLDNSSTNVSPNQIKLNLRIGSVSGTTTGGGNGQLAFTYDARRGGTDWEFRLDPTRSITGLPVDQEVIFRLYMSESGSSTNYVGPDGLNYSLATDTTAVFFNTGSGWQLGFENQNDTSSSGLVMNGFRFDHGQQDTDIRVDNIIISDSFEPIPEGGALTLGLLGGAMLLARRRRRTIGAVSSRVNGLERAVIVAELGVLPVGRRHSCRRSL